MSASRKTRPSTCTGTAAIASTPENAPVTRRLMRSAEVSTEPPEVTAFCLATLPNILGARLELREAQAVGGQHIDCRIDVAVLVVEARADDAGRQIAFDVADLLADLVPEVLHLGGWRLVDEVNLDEGNARLRIAFDAIEVWELLQLLLDLVGDLGLHLGRGGAGPCDADDHGLDREGGVFGTPKAEVRIDPCRAENEDHEQNKRPMRDRPFREIESRHGPDSCRFFPRWIPVGESTLIDRANPLTGVELLYAERDDALAVAHPRGDERHVPGEGRNRHRPQLKPARLVDHIHRRAGPT